MFIYVLTFLNWEVGLPTLRLEEYGTMLTISELLYLIKAFLLSISWNISWNLETCLKLLLGWASMLCNRHGCMTSYAYGA